MNVSAVMKISEKSKQKLKEAQSKFKAKFNENEKAF